MEVELKEMFSTIDLIDEILKKRVSRQLFKPIRLPNFYNLVCRVLNFYQERDGAYKEDRWLKRDEVKEAFRKVCK